MEDEKLKVFSAAERLSFTQAAAALYLMQPALTLQIKALERALGARVFNRADGRIQLKVTPIAPGRRLVEHIFQTHLCP